MEMDASAPLDLVLLKFVGTHFDRAILPALHELVAREIVRVIDVLLVYKDADGVIGSMELEALRPELEPLLVNDQLGGELLDREDVDEVAADLERNSSIVVMALENVWAIPLIDAVRAAGGELLDHARVPAQVLAAARAGPTSASEVR
jgi:hypothetical protein